MASTWSRRVLIESMWDFALALSPAPGLTMPDIAVGAQIFDVIFHPTQSLVYTGLLTGAVKAYSYDEQGNTEEQFKLRPSKRSCRGLAMSESGDRLWAVGKSKALYAIDTANGQIVETRKSAHDVPINRIKRLLPNLLATGDDDGVVKLWDPRKPDAIRAYTHHFDFISDFLWLEDKKHLVCTSGDGTLSVLDVRSKKLEPFAHSEDQEDELLSVVAIKGGQKLVVGTQIGVLSIFNRRSGYGDCVDRIPGHPHSIDALCNIPSHYPNSQSTILTGSSDGLLRAVQLLPTKLLGVVADHGEFPIERVVVDRAGEGRWVASAGHEEVLKLTDLKEVFEDDGSEGEEDEDEDGDPSGDEGAGSGTDDEDNPQEEAVKAGQEVVKETEETAEAASEAEEEVAAAQDSSDDEETERKKRKRKKEKDPFKAQKKSKGRNTVEADPSFFADL